jgi:hypothetical protein
VAERVELTTSAAIPIDERRAVVLARIDALTRSRRFADVFHALSSLVLALLVLATMFLTVTTVGVHHASLATPLGGLWLVIFCYLVRYAFGLRRRKLASAVADLKVELART